MKVTKARQRPNTSCAKQCSSLIWINWYELYWNIAYLFKQPPSPEPIKVSPMPDQPKDKVKIDCYVPFPTGQYILPGVPKKTCAV